MEAPDMDNANLSIPHSLPQLFTSQIPPCDEVPEFQFLLFYRLQICLLLERKSLQVLAERDCQVVILLQVNLMLISN